MNFESTLKTFQIVTAELGSLAAGKALLEGRYQFLMLLQGVMGQLEYKGGRF